MKAKEKFLKVYIDSNLIFDFSKIDNIKEIEAKALEKLSDNSQIKFCTSEKTKREIEKHQGLKKRRYLKFIYSWVEKISEKNMIESIPATYGSVTLGSATLGGGVSSEYPLFTNLKQIFDKDDVEHIFQAEKNNLDYFLTLDGKTILKRFQEKQDQLKEIGLKIKIVSPSQLMQEFEN